MQGETAVWEWGLTLARWGRTGAMRDVERGQMSVAENEVTYDRRTIVEHYINDRRGLEQIFRVAEPPSAITPRLGRPGGRTGGSALDCPDRGCRVVQLDLALSGNLSPVIAEDAQAIDFATPGGMRVLHYASLRVVDARGEVLPSWMEGFAEPGVRGIRIVYDDAEAVYPVTVDPLTTNAAWTAESDQDAAFLGYGAATAGDVNGDGYSDVILGAPYYDNGQVDEGRAFVYLGSASGLATTPAWTAEGNQAGAGFGYPCATAGDVNGDGYSDVIVGAYLYDNPQTDEGKAYVYLGSASGLAATPVWTAESNQVGAVFGASVGTAGDVNGDGYSDIIVGAYGYDNGQLNEGRAYVYYGSASGPSATPSWTRESDQANARYGISVATAGDINGDGYSDVVVGADQYDVSQTNEGAVLIYYGSVTGLSPVENWGLSSGQAGALLGNTVSTAGDVNGDGYSDFIVGAPNYSNGQASEGRVYVFGGSASSILGPWSADSNQLGASFGNSVGTAGDVNGDGYADVIIGAKDFDNGETNEGRVFVYLGSVSGLRATPAWTAESDQASSFYGYPVGTAGDVNGDGYSDVIVGANSYDNDQTNEGRVFVYMGSASNLAPNAAWTVQGDQGNALMGRSIATAGDVNGDGFSDVIAGAPGYDNGQLNEGRAYLYLGSASGIPTSPSLTLEPNQANSAFGISVDTAGDVNGDGYSDVIIGSWLFTNGQNEEGKAFLYLGSTSGLGTVPSWTAESDKTGADFGGSVATAGDVNGDGYGDVVVGAYRYGNGESDEGKAFLYLGSETGLATSPAWTVEGNQAAAYLGYRIGTAGDVNGDGYSDVLIGVMSYSNDLTDQGRAYLYLGAASGLAASPAWTAEGDQAGALLGYSVATAGDVNGDGYSDVIIGSLENKAFVYLGSSSGLATTPAWTLVGDQANSNYGIWVDAAGDVNADGYGDVVVGASVYENGEFEEGGAFLYLGSASGLDTSPAWSAEGNAITAFFGNPVASAGDVNGDGYSDVVVGATMQGGQFNGAAFLYYGGGGDGIDRIPRQARTDLVTPIALLGKSDSALEVRLQARGRTPAGRGKVRFVWEMKPLRSPFTGTGLGVSTTRDTGAVVAGSGSAAAIDEPVTSITGGTQYHWRSRIVSSNPFFPSSPWMTLAGNSPTETKFHTPGCVDPDGDNYGNDGDRGCLFAPDCDQYNAAVWSPPGLTSNLRFTSKTTLVWNAPTNLGGAASAIVYDTLRASVASGFPSADCIESDDGPNTAASDSTSPPQGQAFFYLTRAQNACPNGTGSLGAGSSGTPRAGRSCP